MTNTKVKTDFWGSRRGSFSVSALALLVAYATASRAIETGSLQQYALTIVLIAVAINRLVHAIKSHR